MRPWTLPYPPTKKRNYSTWPTLDLNDDESAQWGLVSAPGARVDRQVLEGVEAPSAITSGVTADIRGIDAYNKTEGGAPLLFVFTATQCYVNGVLAIKPDGTAFTLSGTRKIRVVKDQFRYYFTDGVGAIYWYDERDTSATPVIFENVLPAAPGNATAATFEIASKVINALTTSSGNSDIETVTGFHITNKTTHWNSHGWENAAFGAYCPRVNTGSTLAAGDGWYYTYTAGQEPDWSLVTGVTFKIKADASGGYLAFVFGTSTIDTSKPDWGGTVVTFAIPAANTINDITVKMPNLPTSAKKGVKWFGFMFVTAQQSTVSWKALEYQMGTVGKRDYALNLRKTIGSGGAVTVLRGLENTALKDVDAGTKGSKVTLTFAAAVPTGHEMEIWRRDDTVASQYHFLGYAAAGATSFDDATADVSDGLAMVPGRCQPPTACDSVTMQHGRLVGFKPGYGWCSATGDPFYYLDMTPEQYVDLQAASDGTMFNAGSPLKIPLGEIGTVIRAERFGVTTADTFRSNNLLLTLADETAMIGYDALLEGSTPDDLAISQKRPGGTCGVYASCLLKDGRVAKIDPDGDVVAVGQSFDETVLSDVLTQKLRDSGSRKDWVLVPDNVVNRLTAFCEARAYYLNLRGGGWMGLDTDVTGVPTCATLYPGADGGYAVIAGASGSVKRLYDPAITASPFEIETADYIPARLAHAYRCTVSATGVVTASILVDGVVVDSWTVTSVPRKLPVRIGEKFRLRLSGTGKVRHVETAIAERGR